MQSFQRCKWVGHKKEGAYPVRRWGHSASQVGEWLYIFGGNLQSETKRPVQNFYKLNCKTYEFKRLDLPGGPQLRQSHTAFVIRDKVYIWGGIVKQQVSNDCFVFDGSIWGKVEQKGMVPPPRQSHVSVVVGKYALIYGGIDGEHVYGDFHIFDSDDCSWMPVAHTFGVCPGREGATLTVINDRIFLFGGQNLKDDKQVFLNDLYGINLDGNNTNFKADIQSIKAVGKLPPERSGHCSVGYSNRYLIVIAGITYSIAKDESPHILSDLWVFDLVVSEWKEINCMNRTLFKKHANFTASILNENIIVFGGLKSTTTWSSYDQLLVLQLFDLGEYKLTTLCSTCSAPFVPSILPELESQAYQVKQQKLNLRMVCKMAQLIQHPFHAIGLLIKASIIAKSTKVSIRLDQFENEQVLSIFDNSLLIDKEQFESVLFDTCMPADKLQGVLQSYTAQFKEYSNAVKFGSMKLAESFMMVHSNETGNMVGVLTPDSPYLYNIYFNHRFYQKDQNWYQKCKDYSVVSKIFKYIGETHHSGYHSKKILFGLRCGGKKSNYQMIVNPRDGDLVLKRVVGLDGRQESLRQYIQEMFVDDPLVCILLNQSQVEINTCRDILFFLTFKNGLDVKISGDKKVFNVYHKGYLVARKSCSKFNCSGVVILPEDWPMTPFGLGTNEQTEALQLAIDHTARKYFQTAKIVGNNQG